MRIPDKTFLDTFRRGCLRCEWCSGANGIQTHHWYHRGQGDASRLDIPINIVGLCVFCHSREESGQISRDDLMAVIAAREKLLQPCIKNAIYLLLRLPFRTPADVLKLHPEKQEYFGLITSAGLPTLAGRCCGVQGRVLK